MLALSAGLIFCFCGFLGRLPKGVTVNGIDVGGKTRAEAARAVRESIVAELKTKSLTVRGTSDRVFTYPEIGYKDNLQQLLKNVEKGREYTAEVSYYLNGISEITAGICNDESRPVIEPYAAFNSSGEAFTYYEGCDGLKADRLKLLADIRASLSGDFCDVAVEVGTVPRTGNMSEVRYNTRLLSSYTTYFDGDNIPRSHNIRLAAERINGTVLDGGAAFSFNDIVGERTAARGFKKAKIIENGEFVEGTGGGVCQVSTTLFNAALRAGCQFTEYHAHSLAVSYVPPSCDAMVSGTYYDLKFVNTTGYRLYIRARTGSNYIRFDIYGRGDGAEYSYSSKVTGRIAAPEEITDDLSLVKEGKDGTLSEGYLTITRGGIKKTVLFRKDKYAPIKRIVAEIDETEAPQNGADN